MSTDNIDQMPQMAEWFMRRYHKCVSVPVKSKYTVKTLEKVLKDLPEDVDVQFEYTSSW